MAWLPVALLAGGTALQVTGTLRQGRETAGALEGQAATARAQAFADEQAQRREGRQAIGRLAAAMAEAGGGIDEGVLRQSAVAAELDALNIRYGGAVQSQGLLRQARAVRRQTPLLAGAQLLTGAAGAYTTHRQMKKT